MKVALLEQILAIILSPSISLIYNKIQKRLQKKPV